jgi:hypothetical protein
MRIRLTLALILALGICQSNSAFAVHQSNPNGVGVIFGEPTGFTFKHWQDANIAQDAGVAFALEDFFEVYGDYLYHFPGVFGNRTRVATEFTPYVGGGLFLLVSTATTTNNMGLTRDRGDSAGIGVRFPIGIEWAPSRPPIGIYAEITPGLGIIPGTYGYLEGGIGARWYF